MKDIVRCEYCGGDWLAHDPNGRRFCNTKRNQVAKIRQQIEERDSSADGVVVVPRTKWAGKRRPDR